jgi:6-pyruvoyl tetrahydropterin synthase, putative
MRWILTVRYEFDASHFLPDFEGPCRNLHGHRWTVELEVEVKELDKSGVGIDFGTLKKELESLGLDHTHLNDILPYPPSAENVARYIYQRIKEKGYKVISVRVWETPKYAAKYVED